MFKKFLIISLVFILSVTALSGCRKKQPKVTKTYEDVELTYYKVFDDADVIEKLISEYEVKHPGLKIRFKKFDDFSEYYSTILNEMAEGKGPDIFSMQNTWFTSNYRKISPMPEKIGSVKDFENTFVDVAFNDLVKTDDMGVKQIFGLPMTVDTLALYYNKDHFEDRIAERGKPSLTWEGIKEDVALLNKEDTSLDRFEVSGIALGRADNISRAVDILYLLFLQYGVEFYNNLISEATFGNSQGGAGNFPANEALEFFTSFADSTNKNYSWNEYVVDNNKSIPEIEAFARGDVSMIIGYAYTYDLILNQIGVLKTAGASTIKESSVRVAPIPQLYDPEVSSDKRVTYASYFAETVSRNTKHADIAWDFLVFLSSKTSQEYYFEELNKPTSRRDLLKKQTEHPIYGVFASQTGFAESFPIIDYYRYKELFEDVVYRALNGEYGRNLLGDAQKAITKLLPPNGYFVPEKKVEDIENK